MGVITNSVETGIGCTFLFGGIIGIIQRFIE